MIVHSEVPAGPTCTWGDCTKSPKSSRGGMCGMHIERARIGSPAMDAPPRLARGLPLEQRYRVSEDGCWEWIGHTASSGYGSFRVGSEQIPAHRAMWQHLRGPIPDGLVIDHLCRNRACVNPDHLEPVTTAENNRRGMAPGFIQWRENQCSHGHEYTEANTLYQNNGTRKCRRCHADRQAARRARLKAEAC